MIGLSSEVVDGSVVLDADFPCNEGMKADVGAAFEVKRKSERNDGNFIFSFRSTWFSLLLFKVMFTLVREPSFKQLGWIFMFKVQDRCCGSFTLHLISSSHHIKNVWMQT